MNTAFYLDLEGTVLDSWDNPVLVNMHRVHTFVEQHGVTDVNVFSFAIHNEKDRQEFLTHMKPMLERVYGFKVNDVPTAEEVRKEVCKHMGTHFDLQEFLLVWGKARAFQEYAQFKVPRGCRAVLLDDMVPNMNVHYKDLDVKVEMVNVTTL